MVSDNKKIEQYKEWQKHKIEFTFNEEYYRTYLPGELKTSVFDLYFCGFSTFNNRHVLLLRRQPCKIELPILIYYNGKEIPNNTPLKLYVDGMIMDDYTNRETWTVMVGSGIELDGNSIKAIIPNSDFTEEELYGLDELKYTQTPVGGFYTKILFPLHKDSKVKYQSNYGPLESVSEKISIQFKEAYIERIEARRFLRGAKEGWLCVYPSGSWKENKKLFFSYMGNISPNARGKVVTISAIFDKKYIKPKDDYEYRLFWIPKNI